MISQTESFANSAAGRAQQKSIKLSNGESPYWFYPAVGERKGSILFIHGYRGTHEGVEPIVGALANYDCYVPEVPGFGASPMLPVEHTIENYADWVNELVESLKIEGDLSILGHSFGTIVLGRYVTKYSKTNRLVLLNPVSMPAMRGPRTIMTKVSLAWYKIAARIPERLGRWMLGHPIVIWLVTEVLYKGNDPVLKSWIHTQHKAHFSRFANTKMAEEAFIASCSHNLTEYARSINQPVLLLCGDEDDITSIEAQREAATMYADATYVEMLGVGHLPHYERVEVVAKHTDEFITLNQ